MATFFLTFRLAGSIPQSEVRLYKAKILWLRDQLKRVERLTKGDDSAESKNWLDQIERLNRAWFAKTEEILHKAECGPTWMAGPAIADKVAENLHRLDGKDYRLDPFSIMSNHVHTVFKPFLSAARFIDPITLELDLDNENSGLAKIMHSLKGRSARECNILLERSGQFWEHESFDRVIR
jgi:REP-associated tyrosine transposase